jgi:hypothetical protein
MRDVSLVKIFVILDLEQKRAFFNYLLCNHKEGICFFQITDPEG